jgi:KDO2-lipid IV(A) lauroyltransferase
MAVSGNGAAAGVRETTERLAREFERMISAAPADWHMFQPVWDADLAAAERAAGPGEGAPAP